MALTRKFLTALGIEPEKVDEIIAAHMETVNGLKDEAAKFKGDAEKLPEVQKELDKLKEAAKESGGKNPYEVKYNAIKEEFDAYKAEQTAKETRMAKEKAYRALLKSAGVSEKRIDSVLRVTDLDGMELDGDGFKDSDKITETIKAEWSDFIQTTQTKGADTPNPPSQTVVDYDSMSDAEYYKATYKKG